MSQKIMIGNFPKGQVNNRTAFNIDNNAFPDLFNAYVWRGRAKRKRGTVLLGRLQRQVKSVLNAAPPASGQYGQIVVLNGAGAGSANLISVFSLTGSVVLGSLQLTDGTNTYTDNSLGIVTGSPGGSGTINYATGALTITGGAAAGVLRGVATVGVASYSYFSNLPVMGLRDFLSFSSGQSAFNLNNTYPLLLAFDTDYSYQVNQSGIPFFYSTSFYKGVNNPVVWTGQDYQQFWTVNYNGALWATNGSPGFHFQNVSTFGLGNPTTVNTGAAHGLSNGDIVWFYEVTGNDAATLNGKVGTVTVVTPTSFTVAINTTAMAINNSGIFQTLTKTSTASDGIRWYDGDPTNGTGVYAATGKGWVNFAPPLTATGTTVSINNLTAAQYYLVGASVIIPFKDRLLFFGASIQTISGNAIYLPDTVIFSWNGTPYYAGLTPSGETSDPSAYFVNQTGFGGWLAAGISQEIISVSPNEDVLMVGFTQRQTRFAYTSDDILPFIFLSINSEQFGSLSTFSSINFDRGVVTIGQRGIILANQIGVERKDLDIPDEIFGIAQTNNGGDRINSIRDFENEWAYFTYPPNTSPWVFPAQTFMYNYREETWSFLEENYTARGYFRSTNPDNQTWATLPYETWTQWTDLWIDGAEDVFDQQVIGGNQQGFVLIQDETTGEAPSGYVVSITQVTTTTYTINSPDHCLQTGDYIYLSDLTGVTGLDGDIGSVTLIEVADEADPDNFTLTFLESQEVEFSGTYIGGGTFTRLSQPFIQTKQFNPFWDQGLGVRLAVQKYLLEATPSGQITVNINLSQDSGTVWNNPNTNESLEYSQIVYTCREGTNLSGEPDNISAANVNLQQQVALVGAPGQIWHRMNTSLEGDSVQLTITLSDAQMRDLVQATSEVILHTVQMNVSPSSSLA